jgi:phosphate transport system substrate-binding protein
MRIASLVFFVVCGLSGCINFDHSGKGDDVPTAGDIAIGVEYGESFLMVEEMDYFMLDYTKAKLRPKYLCEMALLRQLQMDSLRFVVMNRDFTASEKENLERRDIKVRSVKIAQTSIALVVNKSFGVDSISIAKWKELLTSEKKTWNGNDIGIVFDGSCGSAYQYFSNQLLKAPINTVGLGSFTSPGAVIDYVSSHENTIGVISLNWIADRSDKQSRELASGVKVLKVEGFHDGKYHYPFQSQIRTGEYPFIQSVYMHDLQGYNGLANGFIAFVASQPGQILVKKSGLLPAKDHGRTIQVGGE